jgi:hypothetical protein
MTAGSKESSKASTSSIVARPFSWIAAGLSWRAEALLRKARQASARLEAALRHSLGIVESEAKLIGDSQNYWNEGGDRSFKQNSHWRGVGVFADDSRWLALGNENLRIYEDFARAVGLQHPLERVVEWGCGGGVNAVHFGQFAEEFCGIDISRASLEECARQMKTAGLDNFRPIFIDAANPEAAVSQTKGPCQLLISTYVFELLPTPEYGTRVLRIAHQLLAPGGMAMIQIKYNEANWSTGSRAWGYARNIPRIVTYRIEEFWQSAEACGFTPRMVTLVPKQPLVQDQNYAYFLLQKKPVP